MNQDKEVIIVAIVIILVLAFFATSDEWSLQAPKWGGGVESDTKVELHFLQRK